MASDFHKCFCYIPAGNRKPSSGRKGDHEVVEGAYENILHLLFVCFLPIGNASSEPRNLSLRFRYKKAFSRTGEGFFMLFMQTLSALPHR
jgi:hypothetical protein